MHGEVKRQTTAGLKLSDLNLTEAEAEAAGNKMDQPTGRVVATLGTIGPRYEVEAVTVIIELE